MAGETASSGRVSFIILSTMRSGSNNLQDALNRHPEIECGGEVFNPGHIQFHGRVFQRENAEGALARTAMRFAVMAAQLGKRSMPNLMLTLARGGRSRTQFGFRLFGDHILYFGLERWLDTLHAGGVKFIHLLRRDTFDQAVSLVRAQATGIWKRTPGRPSTAPRIDIVALADRVQTAIGLLHGHKCVTADVAQRCGAMHLDYDDYAGDEQSYDRIQTFLGVPTHVALHHANIRTPPVEQEDYRRLREEMTRRGAPLRFDADGANAP